MLRIRTSYLIHGFAALHVIVTVVCSLLGLPDSLLLTALTMLMTVLICLRRNLTAEFTAINVVLANILGFVIGNLGAELFDFSSELLSRGVATFFTTELLGWGLDWYTRTYHKPTDRRSSWKTNMGWLVFAIIVVFALRLFTEFFIFPEGPFRGTDAIGVFRSFLGNSLVLLLLFIGTVILVRAGHSRRFSLDLATLSTTLGIVLLSVAAAIIHTLGLPFHWTVPLDIAALSRNIVIALLVEMTIFGLTYMVEYAGNIRRELTTQREKRHEAEFRYMALKNQVNPHFLFNSLNILDTIVQDGDTGEASRYIHKLSGIYRYMLQHDALRLVRLGEEVTFATMYSDLLRIRFPEGFVVENDIREEDLGRMIVPCSLQLLLENVTKHNAIRPENPVRVRMATDGNFLTLENNRIPKISSSPSTGIGLQYIRNQYRDLSGQDIQIENTEDTFRVRIPLL